MSQATVLEFIEVAKVDNTLRSQLEAATNSAQLKEIAAQKGYNFAEEEMIAVFQEQGLLVTEEEQSLSEKELEVLAGGGEVKLHLKGGYNSQYGGYGEAGVTFTL